MAYPVQYNISMLTKTDFLIYMDTPMHLWAKKNGRLEKGPSDFDQHLMDQGMVVEEMALAFLSEMEADPEGTRKICFLSAATDGNDGPTDAAGAFASHEVLGLSQEKGMSLSDYLKQNDAYHFFDKLGYLFKTGPTHTNVCDLQIMIVG